MSLAHIGLGSNLGDRHAMLDRAISRLDNSRGVVGVVVSHRLETEPMGGPAGQGRYINAAAELRTTLSPRALLNLLLDIERESGRARRVRWGPRTLDLDILLWEDRVIDEPGLTVPHPEMARRRFVLEPLAAIAPGAVHPRLGLTVRQLLERLP